MPGFHLRTIEWIPNPEPLPLGWVAAELYLPGHPLRRPLCAHGNEWGHPCNGRDYEYKRHGTLSLLVGLDLLTGKVHACIEERHRSLEFTKLLDQIHQAYSAETRIIIVFGNH